MSPLKKNLKNFLDRCTVLLKHNEDSVQEEVSAGVTFFQSFVVFCCPMVLKDFLEKKENISCLFDCFSPCG